MRQDRLKHWRYPADFARRCGISVRTLRALETGKLGNRATFSPATLSAVETALGWEHDTIVRIAKSGGKPRYVRDGDFQRLERAWPMLPPKVRRMLADVAERALE